MTTKPTPPKSVTPALAAFMAATRARRVHPHHLAMLAHVEDIKTLSAAGYSLARIQKFLETVHITISRAALNNFLKSQSPASITTTPGESK